MALVARRAVLPKGTIPVKKLILVLLLLVVVVAGGAFWFGNPTPAPDTIEPSKFQTLPVRFGVLGETVSGTGAIQPHESVVVCAEVSGRVVQLLKDHGDKVKEGEPLLVLDDEAARLTLKRAEAARTTAEAGLKAAEADVEKAKSFADAAQIELDEAKGAKLPPHQLRLGEAKVKAAKTAITHAEAGVAVARDRIGEAEAAVKQAELAVRLAVVRVPFIERPTSDGHANVVGSVLPSAEPGRALREFTVLERKVALNQLVGPPANAHAFTLAGGPEVVEIHAQISEGDISRVAIGQDVVFTVAAYPDDTFPGKVVEVRPVPINIQGAVFYTVVVRAKNRLDPVNTGEFCLRPGMLTSSLDIVYKRHAGPDGQGLWLVPNAALDYPLDDHYQTAGSKELAKPTKEFRVIWVQVDNRTARPVRVKIGAAGKYLKAAKNQDPSYSVVEAWEPAGEQPSREAALKDPESLPELVINAEPPKKSRWSGLGNVLRLQ